ncbi:MAG: MarR family transcriptional regulator [Merdibacter sp.]|nr:MarR family transcriptional regulator [Merdibacter sp.]
MLPTIESLLQAFNQIRKVHAALLNDRMKEENLSPNEIAILIILSNNPHITTATQLSVLLNVSKGLISRSVDHLCSRGILSCQSDEADRRITHLIICEKAKPLIGRLQHEMHLINQSILADISEDEIRQAEKTIKKIAESFQRRNHDEN